MVDEDGFGPTPHQVKMKKKNQAYQDRHMEPIGENMEVMRHSETIRVEFRYFSTPVAGETRNPVPLLYELVKKMFSVAPSARVIHLLRNHQGQVTEKGDTYALRVWCERDKVKEVSALLTSKQSNHPTKSRFVRADATKFNSISVNVGMFYSKCKWVVVALLWAGLEQLLCALTSPTSSPNNLLILGLGRVGYEIAQQARGSGCFDGISGTVRKRNVADNCDSTKFDESCHRILFEETAKILETAQRCSHILISIPPSNDEERSTELDELNSGNCEWWKTTTTIRRSDGRSLPLRHIPL
jgi:hypothetical protein